MKKFLYFCMAIFFLACAVYILNDFSLLKNTKQGDPSMVNKQIASSQRTNSETSVLKGPLYQNKRNCSEIFLRKEGISAKVDCERSQESYWQDRALTVTIPRICSKTFGSESSISVPSDARYIANAKESNEKPDDKFYVDNIIFYHDSDNVVRYIVIDVLRVSAADHASKNIYISDKKLRYVGTASRTSSRDETYEVVFGLKLQYPVILTKHRFVYSSITEIEFRGSDRQLTTIGMPLDSFHP